MRDVLFPAHLSRISALDISLLHNGLHICELLRQIDLQHTPCMAIDLGNGKGGVYVDDWLSAAEPEMHEMLDVIFSINYQSFRGCFSVIAASETSIKALIWLFGRPRRCRIGDR